MTNNSTDQADNAVQQIRDQFLAMGLLRNLLHLTAIIFTLLMPFAGGPQYSDEWNLFFSGILPATAPLIVIIIGLDTMMSSIWRSDTQDSELKAHYHKIIRTHQVVGGILLAAWLAVFMPALI